MKITIDKNIRDYQFTKDVRAVLKGCSKDLKDFTDVHLVCTDGNGVTLKFSKWLPDFLQAEVYAEMSNAGFFVYSFEFKCNEDGSGNCIWIRVAANQELWEEGCCASFNEYEKGTKNGRGRND